jgi:hypothetical protein
MPDKEDKIPWWKRFGLQAVKLAYALLAIKLKDIDDRKKGIEK